ncbi:MAG: hypothetical protein MJZ20_11515 [Bacteroidaceae bacterium]|nr:hypothetical protein [Bacteroidaceae bacterium]
MKQVLKDFLDGFLSTLLVIVVVILILLPFFIMIMGGSGWWLVVWIVELCVVSGIIRAL